MQNKLDTRIYEEAPLKIAVRVCLGIVGLFIVIGIFVSFLPSRPMSESAKWGGFIGVVMALGAIFGTLLIAWLVIKKRRVIVDYKGVEVFAKRPFGQAETAQVLWKEVTAVDVESLSSSGSTITSYKLSVTANGQKIYLMDRSFYDLNFSNLVRDVGKATEHLGYVWELCRTNESRPILDTVPPFCKVAISETAPQNFNEREF